ncbi:helix-turn-helix transcriptional regulator [Glycomyces sp. NPDC046736]|uniref:helix-turn-helix domain-containing protein n=1 Tax=Glycomyces sp. NPDC046736 TaxID=3155615 RepID=UPI0033F3C9E9
MAKPNPPTARARYIGRTMRTYREELGFKGSEVSDHIDKTAATLSRYESGEYPIPGDVFLTLLDLYRVNDPLERASLIQINEDAPKRGWVDSFQPYIKNLANHIWMEGEAEEIQILALTVMHGLTQTHRFAESLMANGPKRNDPVTLRRQLEARMLRTSVLTKRNGPRIKLLMHESILSQRVGGAEVTVEQLERLLEIAELPRAEIRLLPADCWMHIAAGIGVGYTIFKLPEPLPNVVYIDSTVAAIYEEDPDIDSFKETYDALWNDVALSPKASTERIARELKEVKRE